MYQVFDITDRLILTTDDLKRARLYAWKRDGYVIGPNGEWIGR